MIWNGPTMQKVNMHDEADNKSEKIITDTNTVTNTCTRIIPLQNNTQLYVHVHHYKQFKGNKKIRLFETNL